MRKDCATLAPHVQTASSPHWHVEKKSGTPVALSQKERFEKTSRDEPVTPQLSALTNRTPSRANQRASTS